MKIAGYTNPMRSFERKMAPNFAQREFRDPGLSGMHSGLGAAHTMPHLRRFPAMKLQSGGALDPITQAYAASQPNLYNPDPYRRRILALAQQMAGQYSNPAFRALPGSTAQFAYAAGGPADQAAPSASDSEPSAPPTPALASHELEELMQPDDQLSSQDLELKDIVVEALLALEGRHPDPKEALAHFIDTFGPQALADLRQLSAGRRQEEGEEEEEGEEGGTPTGEEEGGEEEGEEGEEGPEYQAGGGLLAGPGSGQSDEIPAATPAGRPVLLSDGEYVIDAPTVSALGDGSTSAGARRLDELRRQIRKDAWGHDKQAKPMKKGGSALVIRLGK